MIAFDKYLWGGFCILLQEGGVCFSASPTKERVSCLRLTQKVDSEPPVPIFGDPLQQPAKFN